MPNERADPPRFAQLELHNRKINEGANTMQAFCVDFKVGSRVLPLDELEVCEYDERDLRDELREFGVETPSELSDRYREVFEDGDLADEFLEDFKSTAGKLSPRKFARGLGHAQILMPRHMLVMMLMGHKTSTSRDYKRNWIPGQLINLTDRTNIVTVRLVGIIRRGDGSHEYRFAPPDGRSF